MNMSRNSAKMVRVTIDVDGYRWRVHGSRTGIRWQAHLVELLGGVALDIPLDRKLRKSLREAVAVALDREASTVNPIREDLVLT